MDSVSSSASRSKAERELTKVRLSAQAAAKGAGILTGLNKLKGCAHNDCRVALKPSTEVNPLRYITDFFDDASLRDLKQWTVLPLPISSRE
jgi:hypothetical protein